MCPRSSAIATWGACLGGPRDVSPKNVLRKSRCTRSGPESTVGGGELRSSTQTFPRRYKLSTRRRKRNRQVKENRCPRNVWNNLNRISDQTGMTCRWLAIVALTALALPLEPAKFAHAQKLLPTHFPEQRTIRVRDPSELPRYQLPQTP